jgi:DNA-binding NarL/FixJ family response regulator
VIIVEDVLLVREGLARLLTDRGVQVVDMAPDLRDIDRIVRSLHPDVAILDIRLPPTFTDEGLRAAADLRAEHPNLGILVLSQHLETAYAIRLLGDAPGRVGYLLKDRVSDIAIIVDALDRIVGGETVIDPTIVSRVLSRQRPDSPLSSLSEREREVLALVAEGLSNKAISEQLFVGERTIETHIGNVFTKLGLHDHADVNRRVALALTWLRSGDSMQGPRPR